jgi:putative transposase
VDGKRVKLPVIGWVRMRESVRFPGQVKSAVVSKMADGWYVALAVETESRLQRKANGGTVGVDLGIKALAVLSTGEAIEGPKPHKILLRRLRRLNQSLSRVVSEQQDPLWMRTNPRHAAVGQTNEVRLRKRYGRRP